MPSNPTESHPHGATVPVHPEHQPTRRATRDLTPDEALELLLAGNRRYVQDKPRHPHQRATHRHHTAAGQHPFAVVLGCADSRVPPEIIFDEGIGDLFVVRTAGHIVDDAIIGSVEFAEAELGTPLVLVLGHEACGAIKAASAAVLEGEHAIGHIASVASAIVPAVEAARSRPGDFLDNAVRANVELVVETLRTCEPVLADRVRRGTLRIVGARYGLDDGVVEVIVP